MEEFSTILRRSSLVQASPLWASLAIIRREALASYTTVTDESCWRSAPEACRLSKSGISILLKKYLKYLPHHSTFAIPMGPKGFSCTHILFKLYKP
jgi:hypothetical protein